MFQKYVLDLMTLTKIELVEYALELINDRNKNRAEILRAAIHVGLNVNYDLNREITLLQYAILKNDMLVSASLINNGADVNKKNRNDETPLHFTAMSGNVYLMNYILSKDVDINAVDNEKNTALMMACRAESLNNKEDGVTLENLECVKILVAKGALVDIKNDNKCTPSEMILYKIKNIISENEPVVSMNKKLEIYVKMYKIIMSVRKRRITKNELLLISDICEMKSPDVFDNNNHVFEIFKMAIEKTPRIVNRSCDDLKNTLLLLALYHKKEIYIDYLLKVPNLDLTYSNKYGMTALHVAARNGLINVVELFLAKHPEQAHNVCADGRSAIEYAIISNLKEDITIRVINLLAKVGVNPNTKNKWEYRSIECSIQYCSENVVSEIISLGGDIKTFKPKKNRLYSIRNGDVIGFAAQFNKPNTVKLLYEKGALINMAKVTTKIFNNDHKIIVPTGLIKAIYCRSEDVLLYLLGLDIIKSYIDNDHIKKYLLKKALDEGITNRDILLNFVSESKYDALCAKFKKSDVEIYYITIARVIPIIQNHKFIIANCLRDITFVLYKICTFESFDDIFEIFDKLDEYYDITEIDSYLESEIINGIGLLLSWNVSQIKTCFNLVKKLYFNVENIDIMEHYMCYLRKTCDTICIDKVKKILHMAKKIMYDSCSTKAITQKISPNRTPKQNIKNNDSSSESEPDEHDSDEFAEFDDLICEEKSESKQSSDESSGEEYIVLDDFDDVSNIDLFTKETDKKEIIEENIQEYYVKSRKNTINCDIVQSFIHNSKKQNSGINTQHTQIIKKALYKLFWPEVLPHHEKMYNSLCYPDCTYDMTPTKINIYKNNKIVAVVYSHDFIKTNVGNTRWIKFYAPNIGRDDKSDENHMFPFLMDYVLEKWPRIEMSNVDINHKHGANVLAYFYGQLLIDGKMETGCFEYFINTFGTLFHRLFRPLSALPLEVKKIIAGQN